MKLRLAMFAVLLFAALGPAIAGSSIAEMDQRANESRARDADYEKLSIQAFWGDITFMSECAPAGGPVVKPFAVYFEVLSNGRLGQVVLDPDTPTADCVRRHVMNHRFPIPTGGPFVTKVNIRFAR